MTSQILKFLDLPKPQSFKYFENEAFLQQIEKLFIVN